MSAEIYLITPQQIPILKRFCDELSAVLDTGLVACLQLRLKNVKDDLLIRVAETILPVCHSRGVPLLLNDRPDLAVRVGCDGCHVGQNDISYEDARMIMGPKAQIGVTCNNSRHLAMKAGEAGADYVAFGAFFPSDSKYDVPIASIDILTWWAELMTIPCVAIGGITEHNCKLLVRAGSDFLAVINAVWGHHGGPVVGIKAFDLSLKDNEY
ncbi:thiamine-phosphate pyrophosphorylase [Candidatus Endolissoclinum faulkneri L2]|uniref:Thiamine-phosphate synthase n=1 Tax=Candidatus Endolissoclinum faulkneri L2 TaxID=1193729 RepID=K7YJ08_9PROT|nr:thiamine phosphate synthase [Candidatus Endolissoclinum faulkneri]AFX99620.1 thiamine-phosphate pyrophosphorylase [Candidatus Endolissoclinum faulkneri L2]